MNQFKPSRATGGALAGLLALTLSAQTVLAEPATLIPAPVVDAPAATGVATAILAGGCFWGVQGVFQHVAGVRNAVSGYAGGDVSTAAYDVVGSGQTGHAEAVQITYDPAVVSYGTLLQIYFSVAHNPTELNYQGPDQGPQYRSAIFPVNAVQAAVAQAYIVQLDAAGVYSAPIVTTIEPGQTFFAAEGYHQDYLATHPTRGYIIANDLPKIEDLKALFPDQYQDDPVLVAEANN